jgi:hypothetical protein
MGDARIHPRRRLVGSLGLMYVGGMAAWDLVTVFGPSSMSAAQLCLSLLAVLGVVLVAVWPATARMIREPM